MSQCMIFCRTNVDCDNLETFLCTHGGGWKFTERAESGKEGAYSCAVLAGMRSQEMRRASLEAFKEGDVRLLICTDVGARGIDVKGLPYIINMTLPDTPEYYIHRIGRVGRADKMGLAISIVAGEGHKEKVWYHSCRNRGVGCTDRRLKEQGGCTIWYDEHELLQQVEEKLSEPILELGPDFELPVSISSQHISYGEDICKDSAIANSVAVKTHVDQIQSSVKELADMEFEAQNAFLSMQMKFR